MVMYYLDDLMNMSISICKKQSVNRYAYWSAVWPFVEPLTGTAFPS